MKAKDDGGIPIEMDDEDESDGDDKRKLPHRIKKKRPRKK